MKAVFLSMLSLYKRKIIARFFNNDGEILDFSYRTYFEWLHDYVKDKYINKNMKNRLNNPQLSKGRSTEDFIIKGKSNKVIKFSKDLLIHYKHMSGTKDTHKYEKIKNIILNEDIKSNSLATKNLIFINKQHPDEDINDIINTLYTKFSESLQINDSQDKGELYRKIIQDSELLLGDIYNYILYNYKEYNNYGRSNIEKKQKRVFKLLKLDKRQIRTKAIQNIKKYENTQINKANSNITQGLNKIIKGFNFISKGLKIMRNEISYAHNKGPIDLFPTQEETLFCLNAATTLSRFLIYKEEKRRNI